MAPDIYERLAAYLDALPAGFPRTESGVEIRILRRLFTPEDAALVLHLTVIAEEPRVVALRAGISEQEAAVRLQALERKGLILSQARGGVVRYMAMQFVIGFWEGQVDKLTPELVEDFENYLPTAFDAETWRKIPQMRVIPVGESIDGRGEVLPYEAVATLVEEAGDRYAVSNCICRQERHIAGEGCDRPMESCLSFGGVADYVTRSGRGRPITREETLEILRRADEAGLVLQAANARKTLFLCTCCGCCCAVLRSIKRHPDPARIVGTAFVAVLHADSCEGCAACEARCQMGALRVEDGRAVLDPSRCLGCGLCVTTCPTGSLLLERKPAPDQRHVPATLAQSYLKIARARGRLRFGEVASIGLRSAADRWRA